MSRGPVKDRRPAAAPAASARLRAPASSATGRMAVQRILRAPAVQRAVVVGPASDAYEHEATAVAERVMRRPADPEVEEERRREEPEVEPRVQRQAVPEAIEERPPEAIPEGEEPEPWPEPEEGELEAMQRVQRLAGEDGGEVPHPGLAARITAPGAGRPVPLAVRGAVASVLPYDFAGVRVHDGPVAQRDAAALSARAFTYGGNVFLGRGASADDVPLMAHELTHVAQQGAARPIASGSSERGPPAPMPVQRQFGAVAPRGWVAERAARVPGFRLLTVALGRNPITEEPVEPTAANVVQAVLDLVPNGDRIWADLQASGALTDAVTWIKQELATLDLTWPAVRELLARAWSELTLDLPARVLERVLAVFAPTLDRLKAFAGRAATKLLHLVLEGALRLVGPLAGRVLAVLRRAGDVFTTIVNDPVGFMRNLGAAIGQGFTQFAGNILEHLKQGLAAWLLNSLQGAGLQLPERFDLRGILSIVLQVLGLTWARVRARIARVVGDARMGIIEKAVPFVVTLAREGVAAAWEQLLQWIGSLQETVVDAIRDWVRNTIVAQAVQTILKLVTPAGAIIEAIRVIYNTIVLVVEQAERLVALANAVLDSLANIAQGKIGAAANLVELTLGRLVPLVIAFFARLLGLGGIADRIRAIIEAIQARVEAAIMRLVTYIVDRAKALLGRAREAVGAVMAWWRSRFKFDVGGEDHELYFAGDDESAKLMVASDTPMEVEAYLDKHRPLPEERHLARLYGRAHAKLTTVKGEIEAAQRAKRRNEPVKPGLEDQLKELKEAVKDLMLRIKKKSTAPKTEIKYPRGLREGLGVEAVAEPLTIKGEEGSGPSVEGTVWMAVKQRRLGGGTHYVRGHLINEQLHGPGNVPDNLTPISQSINQQHEKQIERLVKDRVWARDEKHPEGRIVKFRMVAEYGPHEKTLAQMTELLAAGSFTTDERKRIQEILAAEQRLPVRLHAQAYDLEPDEKGELAPKSQPWLDDTIDHAIPASLPNLEEGAPRAVVTLDEGKLDELLTVPALKENPEGAALIVDEVERVRKLPGRSTGPVFDRYTDLSASKGQGESTTVGAGLDMDLVTRLQKDSKVRLYRGAAVPSGEAD